MTISEAHDLLQRYVFEAMQIEENETLRLFHAWLTDDPGEVGVSLDNGMPFISYPRKPEDTYDSTRRVKVKVRRFLGKIFNTTEADINRAGELLCHVSESAISFEVIHGSDIFDIYNNDPWDENSCMNQCPDATMIYAKNPDKVSMLLATDADGDPIGRALLWKCDDGSLVMDRFYPNHTPESAEARRWAEARGYWIRSDDGLPRRQHWSKDGKLRDQFTVTLDSPDNGLCPYMDSFHYFDDYNDTPTFSTFGDGTYCRTADDQHGGGFGPIESCNSCGCPIDPEYDDYFTDENNYSNPYVCETCYAQNYFYCEQCGTDSHLDNGVMVDSIGEMVCDGCIDNFPECEECGERHPADDLIADVCPDCLEEYFVQCPDCGEYVRSGETDRLRHTVADGSRVCLDCLGDHYTMDSGGAYQRNPGAPPMTVEPEPMYPGPKLITADCPLRAVKPWKPQTMIMPNYQPWTSWAMTSWRPTIGVYSRIRG